MRITRLTGLALAAMLTVAGCSTSPDRETPLTLPGSSDTATQTDTSTAPSTTTASSTDRGDGTLRIVIDGWTMANITPSALQWTDAAGTRYPLAPRVATAADLEATLQADPGIVAAVLARTVTADPTLTCDEAQCRTASGPVDPATLLDLGTGAVLGAMYQSWGLRDGMYIADLPVGETVLSYGTSTVAMRRGGAVTADDGFGEQSSTDSGIRAVGGAWGRIFTIDPAWHNGATTYTLPAVDTIDGNGPAGADPAAFFQGLGAVNAASAQLTDTQMTWRTSPTTGCGAGVVCVPGSNTSTVTVLDRQRLTACSGERRGVIELVSLDAVVAYRNDTHQFGMWDGKRPDGALGTRKNAVWLTAAPLTSGSTKQHHAIAYLYDAQGLVEFTARIADHAVDSPADVSFAYTADSLNKVLDGTWQAC